MRYAISPKLLVVGVLATILLASPGCEPPAPPSGDGSGQAEHAEHPTKGPHGGQLIAFGDHSFHAEVVVDDDEEKITLYLLDGAAKASIAVAEQEAVMNLKLYGNAEQFKFASAKQDGDAEGMTSRFEIVSRRLVSALKTEAQDTADVIVSKDGKQNHGKFEVSGEHGHSHGGSNVDPQVHELLHWHMEAIELDGCTIQLGQHGLLVRAGMDLEPAVTIVRDGKPVADAQVYATLLTGDKKRVLAEEALAVFEEVSSEEPAHYAQNILPVPKDATKVAIQYRIVLASGASKSYEVILATKPAE